MECHFRFDARDRTRRIKITVCRNDMYALFLNPRHYLSMIRLRMCAQIIAAPREVIIKTGEI
ncbi:hypothetical protein HBI56_021370 [Parastagonospora nodorum]|nr:hypothetical protein HBH53_001620 [Parastagonospora nodorum]KAH3965668.1 hypothetical protein HBH52_205470 [Parastagonospora nodorum]KAH3971222.1 hypothetical protein HBH51_111150 [Parastagonospora nodorum]KAH4041260.1 hypothetical protein HBI09_020350 [Parastagonospora nodorum]KAH4058186.1 hypothetical protein HBH49_029750 [Parastagonospora nodorum]